MFADIIGVLFANHSYSLNYSSIPWVVKLIIYMHFTLSTNNLATSPQGCS